MSYEFAAAKQRLQLEHPDAHVFNMEIFLSKNIKHLRTTQGISQADLGSKLKPTKAHTTIIGTI